MTPKAFKSRLRLSIMPPLGLLAALAILLIWQSEGLRNAGKWVAHTDEILAQGRQVQASLIDMETGMRGYLLGGNREFLEPYTIAKPRLSPELSHLEVLVSDQPEQRIRVQHLKTDIEKWINYIDRKISSRATGSRPQPALASEDYLGKNLMDGLRSEIESILSQERTFLISRTSDFASTQKKSIWLIIGASLLVALFLAYFSRRQLKSLTKSYGKALHAEETHVLALQNERAIREMFVSTLSHDLRSPLTSIQMNVQLMFHHPGGSAESREKIALRILHGAQRANRMIEDLLDANRIKAGEKLPLQIEAQNIEAIVKETIEELKLIHGDRFILKSGNFDFRGYWSRDGVRRAFENLCNNAIKYGTPNSPVIISLGKVSDRVEFSVHNQGTPLTSEEQIRLFEPFERSKSAETSGQSGWGLGLALVRGIAEAHGGTVRVDSSAITGTTFTVTIPQDSRTSSKSSRAG